MGSEAGRGANERGAVLILVLVTMLALSSLVVAGAERAFNEVAGSRRLVDEYQADIIAAEALLLAQARLMADQQILEDSMLEDWYDPVRETAFTMTIEPCNAKLRLGYGVDVPRIQKGLAVLARDRNLPSYAAGSLLDWVDEDKTERAAGAETGTYETLTPSYRPRNGPLRSPAEILLVHGWEEVDRDWLERTFTAWGETQQMNLNFVRRHVFEALFPELRPQWGKIASRRKSKGYQSIDQVREAIEDLATDEAMYAEFISLFTVTSRFYEVIIEVRLPFVYEKRRYIVDRNPFQPLLMPKVLHADILEIRPE